MPSEHPVIAGEQQLVDAQLQGDLSALERLLAEDLIYVGLTGELGSRADDLAMYRSGRFKVTRMRLLDRQLRDLGSTVVAISHMDTAVELDGAPMSKVLRYTRVWHLDGTQWRVKAAHLSEVAGG